MTTKAKLPWQARQGDVLVERLTKPLDAKALAALKPIAREDGGVVLAHGEVTGHKHQFRDPGIAFLRNETTGERILVLDAVGLLSHEEHVPPIEVGAGQVRAIQQCQWNWAKQEAERAYD